MRRTHTSSLLRAGLLATTGLASLFSANRALADTPPIDTGTDIADCADSSDPNCKSCFDNGDGTCLCTGSVGYATCCEYDGLRDQQCNQDGSCTCTEGPYTNVYQPSYRVLTIISAKPGNISKDGFTAATAWGTKTQVISNHTKTNAAQLTTSIFSAQASWSVGSSDGFTTGTSQSAGRGFLEPNRYDTFTHLDDHFIIWTNPTMSMTSTAGTAGPYTVQFTDGGAGMHLIDLTLAELINPSLIPTSKQWADEFARLTLADRDAIISLDPWGAYYQEPANYPCEGNVVCEIQKGQIPCQGGYQGRCIILLEGAGPHLLPSTLMRMSENADTTAFRPVDLMAPAIKVGPFPPPGSGVVGGNTGVQLWTGPAPMYLDKVDPARFIRKDTIQVGGPDYQQENGSSCDLYPYSETTSTAQSRGITNANQEQLLIGGSFSLLGAKLSFRIGKGMSYSYTDTTINETSQTITESFALCSSTNHFHQCIRRYFDKAVGTYWFDADSPPSVDPNDGYTCEQ